MRASIPGGRFTIESEIDRYWAGIDEDLQRPVGGEVPWMRFDASETEVDPIYGVSSSTPGQGRDWDKAVMLKYIVAQVFQGQVMQDDRGYYNADTLRLTINMADFVRVFPNVVLEADSFLRDRVLFQNKPFRPTRMYLRGRVLDKYTVITMDLVEVKEEELVNDPQFLPYSD